MSLIFGIALLLVVIHPIQPRQIFRVLLFKFRQLAVV